MNLFRLNATLVVISAFAQLACGDGGSSANDSAGGAPAAAMGLDTTAPSMGPSSTTEPAVNNGTPSDAPSADVPDDAVDDGQEPMVNNPDNTVPRPPVSGLDMTLAHRYLIGRFDTKEQLTTNPSSEALQFWSCEADAPELGDKVLYVEESELTAVDIPTRQNVYAFTDNGDGRIAVQIYGLNNAPAYTGACEQPGGPRFTMADLTRLDGCDLLIAPLDNEFAFAGGTEGQDCTAGGAGVDYETVTIKSTATQISLWRRGYDATGAQITGPTTGPTILRRSVDAPAMNGDDPMTGMSNGTPPPVGNPGEARLMGGETCQDAVDMAAASIQLDAVGQNFTHRITSQFGAVNDYNPHQDSGMAPGCALVYDAIGRDVVFRVTLEPGQTLDMELNMGPTNSAGGIYILNSCDPVTAPDLDGNGLCGSDTYQSHGSCQYGCVAMPFAFTWPVTDYNGVRNQAQDFYVVVDEIIGDSAENFVLDWRIF